jgi:hypothetical protein
MSPPNLIPRIGEKIEQLDTAIFFGSPNVWRYPACVIHRVRTDRASSRLWFRMKNISLDDQPGQKAPAFLFCYNKRLKFYVTVEGDAAISGLAGELGAPEGWQDPLFAHQTTYLIRMEIRHAATFNRPALPVIPVLDETLFPVKLRADFPYPAEATLWSADPARRTGIRSRLRQPKLGWASFLAGLF